MIEIEVWKSNNNKVEKHHYDKSSGTYLFGFSADLLSKKLYKKILLLVKKEINVLHKS